MRYESFYNRFQLPIILSMMIGVSCVNGFVTPPPMTTVTPAIHHVLNRSIKRRHYGGNFVSLLKTSSLHNRNYYHPRGKYQQQQQKRQQKSLVSMTMNRNNFFMPKTNNSNGNSNLKQNFYVASSSLLFGLFALVSSSLLEGPYGVLALWGIASSVVIPLTMYRQAYCVSIGYGFSVMSMGLMLLRTFWKNHHALISSVLAASSGRRRRRAAEALVEVVSFCSSSAFWLTLALVFYGFRLGSFLWMRSVTVESFHPNKSSRRRIPYLNRIPLCLSVSLLYAIMSSPAMYGMRGSAAATREAVAVTVAMGSSGAVAASGSATTTCNPFLFFWVKLISAPHYHLQWFQDIISWVGVGIAWTGAGLEALADAQKYVVKFIHEGNDYDFVGPTGWTYRLCRHPNYLGELLFWFGISLGGAPFFGSSILAWVSSALGLYGIVGIMTTATNVAEKRQEEKYAGQLRYEGWKVEVPGALLPRLLRKKIIL